MRQRTKSILAIAGVASTVLGMTMLIPTLSQGQYLIATLAGLFLVGGLVLLAISFGE